MQHCCINEKPSVRMSFFLIRVEQADTREGLCYFSLFDSCMTPPQIHGLLSV